MTDVRKLGYKDRFTQYLTSVINDAGTRTINDELALSDESQFLVIEVTREQYNKLFNAAMTGCDLVYPEESHNVLWPLWKAASVGTFCETVAGCIDESPAAQIAITNYMSDKNGGGFTGNGVVVLPVSQSEKNMLSDLFQCDRNHAFATARAIVEAIHQTTEDVMEGIDLVTDPADLATIIADEVPILSIIGAAAEAVLWVKETAFAVYQAAWSDTTRDMIACEIFCKIIEDPECSISFDQLREIYLNFAEAVSPPQDGAPADEWFDWLFGLPLNVSVGAVKAGGLMGLIAMWFGSKFGKFGVGHRSLETVIALAADETSNDWEILCDECPDTWTMRGDLDGVVLPAFVSVLHGNHVSGSGIEFTCDQSSPNSLRGHVEVLPPGFTQLSGRLGYRYTLGGTSGSSVNQAVFNGQPDGIQTLFMEWQFGEVLPGDGSLYKAYEAENVTRLTWSMRSSRNVCDGSGELKYVTISGSGSNPFLGQSGWEQV